jgi:hypothetical protein
MRHSRGNAVPNSTKVAVSNQFQAVAKKSGRLNMERVAMLVAIFGEPSNAAMSE